MNMYRRVLTVIITMFALLAMLTACGSPPPVHLVVILGSRANTYHLHADNVSDVEDLVRAAFAPTGSRSDHVANISFIVSDGSPRVRDVGSITADAPSGHFLNTQAMPEAMSEAMGHVYNMRAETEEANLLRALTLAANRLADLQARANTDVENRILVIDSGITTVAPLDMRQVDIQNTPHNLIIEQIRDSLPQMNNLDITVTLMDIGVAPYPQESEAVEQTLRNLWRDILRASGAYEVEFIGVRNRGSSARTDDYPDFYPHVSVVEFLSINTSTPSPVPTLTPSPSPSPEPPAQCAVGTCLCNVVICTCPQTCVGAGCRCPGVEAFDIETLNFIENMAVLVCEDTARTLLHNYINNNEVREFLRLEASRMLYIVGSEARVNYSGGNNTEPRLSSDRATVIRYMLINDFDIPASRIIAYGAGTHIFSWRNAEEFPHGRRNPCPIAQNQNRVVAIVPNTSEAFTEVEAFLATLQ